MSAWAAAASIAAPFIMGAIQGQQDKKEAENMRDFEAAKQRYAALTGTQGQYVRQPNMWAKPMQGALQGFSFYQQNKGMFDGDSGGNAGGNSMGLHDSEAISSRYGYGPTVDKARAMNGQMPTNPWMMNYGQNPTGFNPRGGY